MYTIDMHAMDSVYCTAVLLKLGHSCMGSAAGGAGGRPPPPSDFGENMDFFDFCNDKSDFLSIPPPSPPRF